MFGLKKKLSSSFLASDTQKTLSTIRELPSEERRNIAQAVAKETSAAAVEITNAAAPSAQMDEIIHRHLTRAKEFRHQALQRGATSASEPLWAAAALYESWIIAVSGEMEKQQSDKIQNAINGWLDEEFERWKREQ